MAAFRWEYGVLALFVIGVIVLAMYKPHIDMSILEGVERPSPPAVVPARPPNAESTVLTI